MDFQFISDSDLLFPIASLVIAVLVAFSIDRFLTQRRIDQSSTHLPVRTEVSSLGKGSART